MEPDLEQLLRQPPRPIDGGRLAPDDWLALLEGAARHGLVGALLSRLPSGGAGPPPAFREKLHREIAGLSARAGLLATALDEALRMLEGGRIPVVALKGPVLAERLYPEPATRPSTDLDLLVADADFDRAAAALEGLGYELDRSFTADYQRRHHHHVKLTRARGPAIELHHRAVSGFGTFLPAEELVARARPFITATGARVLTLSAEDELLYLCVHAAGHLFARLGWLQDLLLLLERHPDLDWALVVRRAGAARSRSALDLSLLHLGWLGASIPDTPFGSLGARRARVAERIRKAALHTQRRRLHQGLGIAYHTVLCDSAVVAARYLAHHIVWFMRRRSHRALLHLRRDI